MKIREIISSIKNSLDSLVQDTMLSGEHIYNVAVNYSSLFLKREADNKKIYKNLSSFLHLDCVELKEVSMIECKEHKIPCSRAMRSKLPIPTPMSSSFGSVIKVFNLTGEKEYSEVNIASYKNISQQRYKSKSNGYFLIKNNYLYILDSEVEAVSITILTSDFNNSCKILDEKFPAPDYLLATVIESTIKQLLTTRQIVRDENSNLDERT